MLRSGQVLPNVDWPGRFEILRHTPPVVVDSAHNRDSALKLRLTLDDYFPGQPVVLVFGASADKNIEGMFAELMPRVQQVIVTRSYHPRAMEPEELKKLVQRFGKPVKIVPTVEDALNDAIQIAGKDSMVLVTGSIFVCCRCASHLVQSRKQLDLEILVLNCKENWGTIYATK